MLTVETRTHPEPLRRSTHVVRRGAEKSVRWVRFSPRRVDSTAPSLRMLSEHDPLLALAMVAPLDTVLAAIAADQATIRIIR